jgi:hypothetical protein
LDDHKKEILYPQIQGVTTRQVIKNHVTLGDLLAKQIGVLPTKANSLLLGTCSQML